MLSPFAISPQQTSPDLLFYWLPLCSASALANTSKDPRTEDLIHKPRFLERGLKLDLRAPKPSYNYLSGSGKYHYERVLCRAGGTQRRDMHQKTTVYMLAQTSGCIPFHIIRLFLV